MRRYIVGALLVAGLQSQAQDRVFTHTYQSNVLPYSVAEVEFWTTLRSGKDEFYNALDHRLEFEFGTGKNWQTALYLNMSNETFFNGKDIQTSTITGFSNEWKWKVSDPVANKVGFGLYGEVGFNGKELELEGKLIFDKKFGNNLLAVNLVGEYEVEYEVDDEDGEVEAEGEVPFQLTAGYMHFIGQNFGIGLELRDDNVSSEDGGWEYSVLSAGPAFHFNGNRWFVNFGVTPQIANLKKAEGVTDNLELHDHTKMEARVLLSFQF